MRLKKSENTQLWCSSWVDCFGLYEQISVEAKSLFHCNEEKYFDRFDVVCFPGVIYHVSGPVLALRILFNTLRPGGIILVESQGILGEESMCRYEGGTLASHTESGRRRVGWNWFRANGGGPESHV